MTENSGIDKRYVERYLNEAESANSEDLKNNALYRVGTQMEIIPCNGDADLSKKDQQIIINAAKKLLEDG